MAPCEFRQLLVSICFNFSASDRVRLGQDLFGKVERGLMRLLSSSGIACAPFFVPYIGVQHCSLLQRFRRGFARGDSRDGRSSHAEAFEGALGIFHCVGSHGGLAVVLTLPIQGVSRIAGGGQFGNALHGGSRLIVPSHSGREILPLGRMVAKLAESLGLAIDVCFVLWMNRLKSRQALQEACSLGIGGFNQLLPIIEGNEPGAGLDESATCVIALVFVVTRLGGSYGIGEGPHGLVGLADPLPRHCPFDQARD
jgi:hypothetical protein